MDSVAALLGRLQGAFTWTFLFAGLLPACVVLLGITYALHGTTGFQAAFEDLVVTSSADDSKQPQTDAATSAQTERAPSTRSALAVAYQSGLALLAIAAVFYFYRQLLLGLYRSLPGWPLWPLRAPLQVWQERSWGKILAHIRELESRYTAVYWAIADNFAAPTGTPHAVAPPASVLAASRRGRDALSAAAQRYTTRYRVSNRRYRHIVLGLSALYDCADQSWRNAEYAAEVADWQQLFANQPNVSVHQAMQHVRARFDQERQGALQLRKQFPDKMDWLKPTDLGNRLAALDDYAHVRYGMDTSTFLLRLWGILPAEDRQELTNSQLGVEANVALSVACYLVAAFVVAARFLPTINAAISGYAIWDVVSIVAGIVMLLAGYLFYRAAVVSVVAFSERVMRAIDLNYLKLITAAGIKPPQTLAEARTTLGNLQLFYVDGDLQHTSNTQLV